MMISDKSVLIKKSTLAKLEIKTTVKSSSKTKQLLLFGGNHMCEITEVKGNLFDCDPTSSLAHCVSRDLNMGRGIAPLFKEKFKRVNELIAQNKKIGECAILDDEKRFVYYLITKEKYYGKPSMETIKRSLCDMKAHCEANQVKKLAMPRIGCGLDRLSWKLVKALIAQIFNSSGIDITIYYL